jgi:hypothetical protein
LFEVLDRRDLAREPRLWFKGDAIISTLDALTVEPNEEMELRIRTHLEIEANFATSQGKLWHTGNVDLVVEPPTNSNLPPCNVPNVGCPAEIEVFGTDSCNVFFADLPKPGPQKTWRSLELRMRSQVSALTKLVDAHANASGSVACALGEAMFVEGDVYLFGDGVEAPLDLNGLRLYYGSLTVEVEPGFKNGTAVELIVTEFGDFNGDCVINEIDDALFPDVPPGQSIVAELPIFDFDGDGFITSIDTQEFISRRDANPPYVPEDCTGGSGGPAWNCPASPAPCITALPFGAAGRYLNVPYLFTASTVIS